MAVCQTGFGRFWFITTALSSLILGCTPEPSSVVKKETQIKNVEQLWEIASPQPVHVDTTNPNVQYRTDKDQSVEIRGGVDAEIPVWLHLTQGPSDFSKYTAATLHFSNAGQGLVQVRGCLVGTTDDTSARGLASCTYLMPGETGKLVIPLQRKQMSPSDLPSFIISPDNFRGTDSQFDDKAIQSVMLTIDSSDPNFHLADIQLGGSSEHSPSKVSELAKMPLVDAFGQRQTVDWPGKIADQESLEKRAESRLQSIRKQTASVRTEPDIDSPANFTSTAGRRFSVEKRDGRWWFIASDEELFWSLGIQRVGRGTPVRLWKRRALFHTIPAKEGTPLSGSVFYRNRIGYIDQYQSNLMRQYGDKSAAVSAELNAKRMIDWGLNTLGYQSLPSVIRQSSLPYMVVIRPDDVGIRLVSRLPDPFHPDFRSILDAACLTSKSDIDDPERCIGVFCDENQKWPHDLVDSVLRTESHSRDAMMQWLRDQYLDVDALGAAWGVNYSDWSDVRNIPQSSDPVSKNESDRQALYALVADQYFSICDKVLETRFPGQLFLGSGLGNCPEIVTRSCAKHADVVSFQRIHPSFSSDQLPADIDRPILISKFQFGALDAGVPGWGNVSVHSQTQRSRIYMHYVIDALQDPRTVGVQWSSFVDQNAAAEPGAGNFVGFVDITDTPYTELVTATRTIANSIEPIRNSSDQASLKHLFRKLGESP